MSRLLPRVSVIVVTYNSAPIVGRCLQALREQPDFMRREVLVVDNASSDGTSDLVRARFPEARVIDAGANLGFAAANNLGLGAARGRYVLFLNPDAFLWPDALPELLTQLGADPEAGMAGPKLLNGDGTLQHSAKNFPSVTNQLFEAFMLHKAFRSASRRYGEVIYDDAFYASPGYADWLSGAVLLARREALGAVGGFDERFFLYSEEKDLQLRLARAGWRVRLVPSAVATHAHGDTFKRELFLVAMRSKGAYIDKHFDGWRRVVLRLALILYLSVRLVTTSLRSLLGRGGAERLPGYLGGIRLVAGGVRGGNGTP